MNHLNKQILLSIYNDFKKNVLEERKKHFSKKRLQKELSILYKNSIGHDLDWNNLRSYTEKMQWEKIYNIYPLKIQLTDKYEVRKWVKEKIGEEYLVPLIGVWNNSKEIDFNSLPENIVLKTNCGSGDAIIIKNKSELNADKIKEIRKRLNHNLNINFGLKTYEMHYMFIKPRIIAEELIESDDEDLPDYKFLCFNGQPHYCWVDIGRYHNHRRNVYDLNWNLQKWNQGGKENTSYELKKPENFDKMIELTRILCKDFSHVRVDFYNVNGRVYFGEMTFTNGSGLDKIVPESVDIMLGELWKL